MSALPIRPTATHSQSLSEDLGEHKSCRHKAPESTTPLERPIPPSLGRATRKQPHESSEWIRVGATSARARIHPTTRGRGAESVGTTAHGSRSGSAAFRAEQTSEDPRKPKATTEHPTTHNHPAEAKPRTQPPTKADKYHNASGKERASPHPTSDDRADGPLLNVASCAPHKGTTARRR